MSYPSSYDSLPTVNSGDLITASGTDGVINAVNNIETTLGLTPYGSYATVAAALAGKKDVNYAADSGAANAYVVTLSPAPSSLTAGLLVTFKAANPNTGASTVNVNSLGAVSIKKENGVALGAGDIQAGQIVEVIYDGTNFQIPNTLPPALYYVADSGTANTYVVTLSPAPAAYVAGLTVAFNAAHANTGASTLNVNSLGAKSIKKLGSTALEAADIAAGQIVIATYDGTNFQLVTTLQVSPGYAGQSTITTVGTVATGTWNGTVVGVAYGGTGASLGAPALGTIIAGTGSVFNELTVGSNGQSLVADSTQTLGLKWGLPHKIAMATKTGNYTVAATDTYIRVDASSNNVTITLLDATTTGGATANQWFEIKRVDSSGHTVTVNTTSSQTIDGNTSTTLASNATLRVISNNSNWDII